MITFQFVLNISVIAILLVQDHHSYVCLYHTWHEQWIRLSFHNGSPRSIGTGFTLFTHFCDCSVKTELIYTNNCAKNSFNRFKVGAIVYRQFSTTFALKHSSGQWTRRSKDCVCAFTELKHHQLSNFVPFSLWTVFTNRVPLFLRSRSEE